jgi:hypothetical protein
VEPRGFELLTWLAEMRTDLRRMFYDVVMPASGVQRVGVVVLRHVTVLPTSRLARSRKSLAPVPLMQWRSIGTCPMADNQDHDLTMASCAAPVARVQMGDIQRTLAKLGIQRLRCNPKGRHRVAQVNQIRTNRGVYYGLATLGARESARHIELSAQRASDAIPRGFRWFGSRGSAASCMMLNLGHVVHPFGANRRTVRL